MRIMLNPTVLLHQHIFGNVGEFVDQYFNAAFANNWQQIDQRFREKKNFLTCADLLPLVCHQGARKVFSTMRPVKFGEGDQISTFFLLADPIIRANQVFIRVAGDSTQPNSRLARERGFKGYVEWALNDGYGGVVLRNYQTLHLSDAAAREVDIVQAQAGDTEICEAREKVRIATFVGLTDRPLCSIRGLQKVAGERFPELKIESFLRYFAEQKKQPLELQRTAIRDELGEELFRRLVDANQLDSILYECAREKFEPICDLCCLPPKSLEIECECLREVSASSTSPERPFFFLHIPKTAGTAFSLHLKNQFNHQDICPAGYWQELLEMPKEERVKYKLIAGHFSDFARAFLDGDPQCIVMLRNPIDRVLSLIYYQKYLCDNSPQNFANAGVLDMSRTARALFNQDIQSILMTDDPRILEGISNYQTRVLLGGQMEPTYQLNEVHLRAAKANLLRYKLVGLTERMQESLDMLSFIFGWQPIQDVAINQTPKVLERENVAPWVLERIRELNSLDMQLYDCASELFESQKMLMPKFVNRLELLNGNYLHRYKNVGIEPQERFSHKLSFGPVGSSWWEWEEHPNGGGCRWTGPGVDSFFDVPVIKSRDLLISFCLVSYASEVILSTAIISADGKRLETRLVVGSSGERFIQAVAGVAVLDQTLPYLRVGIHLSATIAANKNKPAAANNRRLGVAIHSVEIVPVELGLTV